MLCLMSLLGICMMDSLDQSYSGGLGRVGCVLMRCYRQHKMHVFSMGKMQNLSNANACEFPKLHCSLLSLHPTHSLPL